MSKIGLSRHSGAEKRRSLRSFSSAAGAAVTPPSILPQVSSPFAQAWAPALISAIGSSLALMLGEAEGRRGPGRERLPFFRLLRPDLHQHLLRAAHDQRPVLPVLQRRDCRTCFRIVRHASNVGLMQVLPQIPTALVLLDYFGIAVFAISGALLAAEKTADLGHLHLLRGGDGRRRRNPARPADRRASILGPHQRDAADLHRRGARHVVRRQAHDRHARCCGSMPAGLGAYATYGAAKAMAFGVAPVPAFVMGVLTACAGGIIRDVLANQPSILMRPELYVTAAALASGLFVGLTLLGTPVWMAAVVSAVAGFALRGTAIARGLSLPAYGD